MFAWRGRGAYLFFSRLNAELSQHPTLPIPELIFDSALQAVKRTARLEGPNQQWTLEELRENPGCFLAWNIDMVNLAARQAEKLSADDPNISASDKQRFMSKALETMQLVLSESMLVAQEAGKKGYLRDPLRESSEEYVALRQGVDQALQSFHRYAIGAASIDNTKLEAILATSLSGKQTRGGYNSSLIAREEGEGRFVTMRRVFAGESSQVGVVFHDAEKLITSHPSAAEAADAKVEDPESLERFLKLLKLELAEKEAFAAREEGLETKFAFKLLSFKLGTPTVQSEERFAERISYLSPLTGGLLEELKNHSQGRTGAEQPDEAEVALYHMLLQGGATHSNCGVRRIGSGSRVCTS